MAVQKEISEISVEDFRHLGYLQEVNRLFLHPHGLALSVQIEEDGTESFGIIWDYRNDPEGLIYDDQLIDHLFIRRATYLEEEFVSRAAERLKRLGYVIQPILPVEDENGET